MVSLSLGLILEVILPLITYKSDFTPFVNITSFLSLT